MLKEFIKQFTEKEIVDFNNVKKLRTEYFLVSKELILSNKPFIHAGNYLGKEGKLFTPSLWLLQELAKSTDKIISVDEKQEWLFICGRDILRQGKYVPDKLMEGDLVLVVNKHNEYLGYGIYSTKKVLVKRIFDIGDFLRRERN